MKPKFVKFSEVQQAYLTEVRNRQVKEWNEALLSVYRDAGIMEKIIKAQPGTYQVRQRDLSGLDVFPPPAPQSKKKIEGKKPDRKNRKDT